MSGEGEIEAALAALDEGPHESFADVGGGALALAIAVALRWGSSVDLIDLTRKGGFDAFRSDWLAPYLAALAREGIEGDRVRVVARAADIRPVDMIANLHRFGDGAKIAHLAPVLDRAFHADSRMIADILEARLVRRRQAWSPCDLVECRQGEAPALLAAYFAERARSLGLNPCP